MHFWAIFCQFQSFYIEILNPLPRNQTTLDFKNIFTQVCFYQKANLGQLTAKSEEVEFFWGDTLVYGQVSIKADDNSKTIFWL